MIVRAGASGVLFKVTLISSDDLFTCEIISFG
jgi:hypothetical protein